MKRAFKMLLPLLDTKGLSLKQIKQVFLEGEILTLIFGKSLQNIFEVNFYNFYLFSAGSARISFLKNLILSITISLSISLHKFSSLKT